MNTGFGRFPIPSAWTTRPRPCASGFRNATGILPAGISNLSAGHDWYLPGGQFELGKIIQGWHRKHYGALATGHEGLRISGNALWQQTGLWKDFCDYERALDNSIVGHRMLILCTYSLGASRARDILDVARAHQCTIARRNGEWDFCRFQLSIGRETRFAS